MSTTSARVEIPAERWNVRKSAVLVALIIAVMAGVFGVYALTRPAQAPIAATVEVDKPLVGCSDCTANLTVAGGVVKDQAVSNACDSPARSDVPRGLRIP